MHIPDSELLLITSALGCRVEGFPQTYLGLPLLQTIDALGRAFLWNVGERASGARCLVAWSAVCQPKREGGLGIKQLASKNTCLQMKLLHRLHSVAEAPWAAWAGENMS